MLESLTLRRFFSGHSCPFLQHVLLIESPDLLEDFRIGLSGPVEPVALTIDRDAGAHDEADFEVLFHGLRILEVLKAGLDRREAAAVAGLLEGEGHLRRDSVRIGDLRCVIHRVAGDGDDVREVFGSEIVEQGRDRRTERCDGRVTDDLDIWVAEVPAGGLDHQFVLLGVEAHHLRGDAVGLDRVIGGDDLVHLDRVDGSGRVALAADDAVDDGQVRLEQVQKVGEFLVDLVGVVPLPKEVRNGGLSSSSGRRRKTLRP